MMIMSVGNSTEKVGNRGCSGKLEAFPQSLEAYCFLNDLGRGDHPVLNVMELLGDVPAKENVIYVGRRSESQEKEGYVTLEDAVEFSVRRLWSRRRIRNVLLCDGSSGEQTVIGAYKRIRDKKPGQLRTFVIPCELTDLSYELKD